MSWEVFRNDWGLMPGARITCSLVISFDFSVPFKCYFVSTSMFGVVSTLTQDHFLHFI